LKVKFVPICVLVIFTLLMCSCAQTTQPSELEFMQDATSELTCEMFQEQPHHSGDIVLGVLRDVLGATETFGFAWMGSLLCW
jgi:hypothetical protein